MNYEMVKGELRTLSEDLGGMAEGILGPEPPAVKPGNLQGPRTVKAPEEVRKELEYVMAKLRAVVDLTRENKPMI